MCGVGLRSSAGKRAQTGSRSGGQCSKGSLANIYRIQTFSQKHAMLVGFGMESLPAFVLNRSSRVMPGFRGTPAGMTTRSAPYSAALSSLGPVCAVTCQSVHTALMTLASWLHERKPSGIRGACGQCARFFSRLAIQDAVLQFILDCGSAQPMFMPVPGVHLPNARNRHSRKDKGCIESISMPRMPATLLGMPHLIMVGMVTHQRVHGRRQTGKYGQCNTLDCVLMWPMSAPTPGVPTTSYSRSSATAGLAFSSSASGWPMPPAAPSTATENAGSPADVALRCTEACSGRFGTAGHIDWGDGECTGPPLGPQAWARRRGVGLRCNGTCASQVTHQWSLSSASEQKDPA